jgi:hypothetical protein
MKCLLEQHKPNCQCGWCKNKGQIQAIRNKNKAKTNSEPVADDSKAENIVNEMLDINLK